MARRPNTIVQRIALEGGKDIEAELKALGAAGEIAFRKLKAEAEKSAGGLDKFGLKLKALQKDMQALSGRLTSLGTTFSRAGRTLSIAVTAPIVAGFGLAVKAATEFESKMADIRRVSDFPTPEAFQQFGKDLLDMSVALGVAIGDLQDIAQAAAAAGVPFNELLGFTDLVAKSSVALGLSAAETGDALAKIKTAAGLGVDGINQLVGAIARLADAGAVTDQALVNVVLEVGAVGRAAGVTLEQVAAIGAAMISMGVDSDTAGVALRNMILELTSGDSASKTFSDALKKLGLDASDVAKRLQKDAIGTILDLFERIRKQAPEVRLALLSALFDKRGAAAIAPLLNNLGELRKNLDLVADAAANTTRVNDEFLIRFGTAEQKFARFSASVTKLAITVGNTLLPQVLQLTEAATNLLATLSNDAPLVQWGIIIAGIAAAIGPVIFAIGQMLLAFGGLAKGAALLTGAFITLNATIAAGGLTAALLGLAAPIAAFLAALGLTAGALYLLYRAFAAGDDAATQHAESLNKIDASIMAIKAGIPGAVEETNKLIDADIKAAKAALEHAKANLALLKVQAEAEARSVNPAFGIPQDTLQSIQLFEQEIVDQQNRLKDLEGRQEQAAKATTEFGNAQERAAGQANNLNQAVGETADTVSKFPGPSENIRTLGDPFAKAADDAKKLGDEVDETDKKTKRAGDSIGKSISGAAEKTRAATTSMADHIRRLGEDAPKFVETGKNVLQELGGVGVQVVRDLGRAGVEITSETQRVLQGLKTEAQEAKSAAESITDLDEAALTQSLGAIPDALSEVKPAADAAEVEIKAIGTSASGVSAAIQASLSGLPSALQTTWNAITLAAQTAWTSITTSAQATAATLGAAWEQAVTAIQAIFAGVGPGIVAAWQGIVGQIQAAWQGLVGGAASAGQNILSAFSGAARDVAEAFADAFSDIENAMRSLVSSVQSMVNQISSMLSRIRSEIAATKAAAASANSGGEQGLAAGGMVRGGGTTTSDSILARLSRGEFVVRARAVAEYGPEFFRALNAMRVDPEAFRGFHEGGLVELRRVFSSIPRFNVGDLVDSFSQSFAIPRPTSPFSGQQALDLFNSRPMGTVNINLAGQNFPMQAPVDVVGEFIRAARDSARLTIGSRPVWAKG